MMRRTVYLSASTDALTKAQVEEILQVSQKNNSQVGITGFLAYHDRCFFQVIEGPDHAIEEVLKRIRVDARHSGLLVLTDTQVDQRAFPHWSMAFVARNDLTDILDNAAMSLTDLARKPGELSADARVNKLFNTFIDSFRDLKPI